MHRVDAAAIHKRAPTSGASTSGKCKLPPASRYFLQGGGSTTRPKPHTTRCDGFNGKHNILQVNIALAIARWMHRQVHPELHAGSEILWEDVRNSIPAGGVAATP